MAFLNMYKRVSLSSVAESQSYCIFLAMDLVVGPDLRLLPSAGTKAYFRYFPLRLHSLHQCDSWLSRISTRRILGPWALTATLGSL